MYPSFMGTFNFLTLILDNDSMPDCVPSPLSIVSFHTTYLSDPWTLPSLGNSNEGPTTTGIEMQLSIVLITYQSLFNVTTDPSPSPSRIGEEDCYNCCHLCHLDHQAMSPNYWCSEYEWIIQTEQIKSHRKRTSIAQRITILSSLHNLVLQ